MVVPNVGIGLAGAAMTAFGFFLAGRKDSQLAVRVLGVYFVLRGLLNATNGFGDALRESGFAVGYPYFWGLGAASTRAIPFLVLVFASLYPRRRGPLGKSRRLRWGAYGVAFVLAALRVSMEVSDSTLIREIGYSLPVTVPFTLLLPSYMLAGMVFVRDYFHETPVPDRDGLLFVAVGFMFDAIYLAVADLFGWMVRPVAGREEVPQAIALLTLVPVLGLLGFNAIRTDDPGERRKMVWTMLGLILPAVLGILVSGPVGLAGGRGGAGIAVDALSIVAFPLLIVYGVLRHDLLEIDIDLSRGVKYAATAIFLVGVYAAISLTAQIRLGGVAGQTVAVLATGLLVVGVVYLARTSGSLASAGLVGREGSYLDREALDVYKGTLEEALAVEDGRLSEGNERMLARMRERLGVTDREHALLLDTLGSRPVTEGEGGLLAPGNTVAGRYLVEEELAQGGQGATYVAHDTQLDRSIVLKQLNRTDGGGSLDLSEEARRLVSVDHPCVVTVHDVLALGDRVLIVMEHLRPGSLADRLQDGRLGLEAFRRAAMDALTALEVIHDEGMIHRDVKPANLLLTEDGDAKLTDFGISHVTGEETTIGLAADEPIGTLRYMSPEQAKGQPVDERSDLFSLAATLYEAYTGEPYVRVEPGESMVEVQMRVAGLGHFEDDLEGPEALEAWFERALAPRPADRFASAGEMRRALVEALDEGRAPA